MIDLNKQVLIEEEFGESSEESFHWPEIKKSDGRKMKCVFWDKLNQNQSMSSIWAYIYKYYPNIHFDRILDLYEDKIHRKKGKSKFINIIKHENRIIKIKKRNYIKKNISYKTNLCV